MLKDEAMSPWYYSITYSKNYPLQNLPPAQRFQITNFLSILWTTAFTASTIISIWYGKPLTGHVLLALATFITGATFRLARRDTVNMNR